MPVTFSILCLTNVINICLRKEASQPSSMDGDLDPVQALFLAVRNNKNRKISRKTPSPRKVLVFLQQPESLHFADYHRAEFVIGGPKPPHSLTPLILTFAELQGNIHFPNFIFLLQCL